MADFLEKRTHNVLDISWGTILRVSFSVFCFYILYLIRDILVWSFLAFLISVLFDPIIDFLQKVRVPRILGVIFIYTVGFGVLALLIYWTAPMFISETQYFVQSLPYYFEKVAPPLRGLGLEAFKDIESFINALNETIARMSDTIFNTLFSVFGGIFSTIFIFSVAIFFSLQEKEIERFLVLLFPKKNERYLLSFWRKSQGKLTAWLLLNILTSLFVGASSFLVFLLFQIKYPLLLGLLAGVLNFIPIIGPLITGFLILLVVSLDSTLKAIFALIVFTLIQQVENNILSPLLTKKVVGIPPALVLISLSIGGKLFGLLGAILAVPIAAILSDFFKEFLERRKRLSEEELEERSY